MSNCEHLNLYPDMRLQLKMADCGHYLIHGHWECQDCKEWIFLECEDEWDGREGNKTKDGQYQYQVIDGKNKMVKLNVEIPNLPDYTLFLDYLDSSQCSGYRKQLTAESR